jgi:hypothetical protein
VGTSGVYIGSYSVPQGVQVSRANVTMSLSASTTSPKVGQNVTFSWQMEPFVENANVTLSYQVDNSTLVSIKNFIQNTPSMNYTWQVTVPGTFKIVVTYVGNENYNPSTASIMLKTS